jgi:hypothetical protein
VAAAAQRRSLALAQSSAGQYGGPAGLAKLHVMAAIAIASGRHAFSIFGASAMARFLGALHYRHNAVGGLFVPRSDNWYRTKGMEEVQALYQVKLKTVVINHSQTGRALQVSADGWTGPRGLPVTDFVLRTNVGPLLLTVADGSEQLHNTGKVKDATYLAQLLREQIRGINAMHPHAAVFVVTQDGASVCTKAARILELETEFKCVSFTKCATHGLDNCMKDVNKIPVFHKMLELLAELGRFIRYHEKVKQYSMKCPARSRRAPAWPRRARAAASTL